MLDDTLHYEEVFPQTFSVKHKIASSTEKRTYHLHTQLEIVFPISNNLICRQDSESMPIPAGCFLLINPMSLHYIDYVRHSGLCDRYVLICEPSLISNITTSGINLLGSFMKHPADCILIQPPVDMLEEILMLLDKMEEQTSLYAEKYRQDVSPDNSLEYIYSKFLLGQLLVIMNQLYIEQYGIPDPLKFQRHSRLVSDICSYIDNHLEEDLSVDELAKSFYISKTKLYRITNEVLHMPLNNYISTVRLNSAKALLASTEYSVEIISQKVGYSNISSFSRFFKAKTGITPFQYRKEYNSHPSKPPVDR